MYSQTPLRSPQGTECLQQDMDMKDQEHTRQMTFQEELTSKYPVTAFV